MFIYIYICGPWRLSLLDNSALLRQWLYIYIYTHVNGVLLFVYIYTHILYLTLIVVLD